MSNTRTKYQIQKRVNAAAADMGETWAYVADLGEMTRRKARLAAEKAPLESPDDYPPGEYQIVAVVGNFGTVNGLMVVQDAPPKEKAPRSKPRKVKGHAAADMNPQDYAGDGAAVAGTEKA